MTAESFILLIEEKLLDSFHIQQCGLSVCRQFKLVKKKVIMTKKYCYTVHMKEIAKRIIVRDRSSRPILCFIYFAAIVCSGRIY